MAHVGKAVDPKIDLQKMASRTRFELVYPP